MNQQRKERQEDDSVNIPACLFEGCFYPFCVSNLYLETTVSIKSQLQARLLQKVYWLKSDKLRDFVWFLIMAIVVVILSNIQIGFRLRVSPL